MSTGRRRALAVAAAVGCLLSCTACGTAGSRSDQVVVTADGVEISDPLGDGQPDIVGLTLSRSESSGAVVRVRLDGLRPGGPIMYSLVLYVDPAGGDTPRFAHRSFIDYAYLSRPSISSTGWDLEDLVSGPSPTAPGCRPSERHLKPEPTVRVVEIEFLRGCIGSSGARLAVRTERADTRAATDDTMRMAHADWWPRRRTMSRTLPF